MNQQKTELRKLIRQKKTQYCASTLKALSSEILNRLEASLDFKAAKTILFYFSLDDEVYTHSFIEKWSSSKTFILPSVCGNDLELRAYSSPNHLTVGEFGIKEPIGEVFTAYKTIDLAVIPGMAFDIRGNRLGRGKGYYDRLLPRIEAKKIGICFPFQIVDKIPTEEFDILMDSVIY